MVVTVSLLVREVSNGQVPLDGFFLSSFRVSVYFYFSYFLPAYLFALCSQVDTAAVTAQGAQSAAATPPRRPRGP
jgi:hypothetical protein